MAKSSKKKDKPKSPLGRPDKKRSHRRHGDPRADTARKPKKTFSGALKAGSKKDIVPDFLHETYGGGQLERVQGYSAYHAMVDGIAGGKPSGPMRPRNAPPVDPQTPRLGVPQSVYPIDDRVRVYDTTAVPWRAICHIIITRESGVSVWGTGWFASSDLVVTAGHNYLYHDQGGYAVRMRIIPAANGEYSPPFGEVEPYDVYIPQEWEQDANPAFDYCLIRLPSSDMGSRTGWFGFADLADSYLDGQLLNLAGYPYDKEYGTLWYHGGRARVFNDRFIAYRIDTEGGQSGAPIFHYENNQRQVVAMHTLGDPTSDLSRWNSGLRVSGRFYDDLYASI